MNGFHRDKLYLESTFLNARSDGAYTIRELIMKIPQNWPYKMQSPFLNQILMMMMMIQMHDIVSTCMRRINNSNTQPSSAVLITWRWISSLALSLSNTSCTWSPQVTYFSHSSLLVSIGFLLLAVIRAVLREALPSCLLHIFQLIFWISALCDVTKGTDTSLGLMTRTPARWLRPAAT